jgi:hypothetical protein
MSLVILQYVGRVLLISGGICGLCGARLMANQYTKSMRSILDLVDMLVKAIFRPDVAKGAARFSEIRQEDKVTTVRGLGLIFVGFLLQVVGGILDIFTFH